MFILNYFIMIVFVLVSVAFVTLLERKILGYIQIRKGPNKVGFMGLLQPFSDGLKLFFKEVCYPKVSNSIIYLLTPMFMLTLSFMLWMLFPFLNNVITNNYGFLIFLCLSGLGVYGLILCGWSSNSIYAVLGFIRSLAQTISYEVSMALLLISMMIIIHSYNFIDFMYFQYYIWFCFMSLPLFFSWLTSCLAETNRSPFDFAEGESELVSGFNVEYGSGGFAFIFLSEYSNIIFMSLISVIVFLGCDYFSLLFFMKWQFIIFWFVWVRGTLPRFRYDKLMYLTWKMFLPLSLNYLLFFIGFYFYMINFIMLSEVNKGF
uniref:NADH dehydrogenase subunit 1 n=1 Tax=Halticus minutus TaxID=2917254 RepID=UPI001F12E164|nr:NADH dehydrogenase subunit 1 [Halticus minutus]UKT60753.1 NADH dehydrogenase subunit 1 [Halticus minutus]